jgi:serine/threonine protein kinase
MNENENALCDDEYAAIFGDTEDALAGGQSTQSIHVPADLRPRLERDLACARLLRQSLRRGGTSIQSRPAIPDSGTVIRSYRLLEKLGEGGMGVVFKAIHQDLDKLVAVKLIRSERVRDPDAAARFKREMQAVGKLEHPNIVRAFDAGEVDGTLYLAMEYVAGVDLNALVERVGPLPVPDACALVRQAALGLQHAHENGRIHRDIKPSNLILADSPAAPDASVKIVDFGLALLVHRAAGSSELTGAGQIMGTLDYMAPEQGGDSHLVDHRADLYSLGATLYKLLTGDSPLPTTFAASPLAKVMALALGEPIPIRQRRPDVPDAVAHLVERLLDRNPANRPAAAAEVAAELEPFARSANLRELLIKAGDPSAGGRASPLVPDSAPARGAKRRHSGHLLIAAIGVAALLLAGAIVVRIATDKGELIIRSPDPNVEITVKRNGKPVEDLEVSSGESNVRVRSGEVEVVLRGAHADRYEVRNNRVILSRGDKPVIEIVRKPAAETNIDRSTAEWVLAQGGWVLIGKERKEVKAANDLPASPFATTDVFLPKAQGISDGDMRRLRDLPGLIFVDISETRIGDAGFALLAENQGIGGLRAHGTLLTNSGAKHLGALKNLQYLKLGSTAITDDALRYVKDLPKPSDLGLSGTAVSDMGLELLSNQLSLARLQLDRTRITDGGLVHLYRLTRLAEVDVRNTRVSPAGAAELRKALPKCKVIAE